MSKYSPMTLVQSWTEREKSGLTKVLGPNSANPIQLLISGMFKYYNVPKSISCFVFSCSVSVF